MPDRVTFPALGTTAELIVDEPHMLDGALALLVVEIEAIDAACSRFRTDSELARVNAGAGRPTVVSSLFIEALDVACRAAELTDGRVDPTVGKAMRVLGYDRDFDALDRSGPPLRVSVGRVPGWTTIEVDHERSTVRIPAGVELDFGATAKALCADRAAASIGGATGAGVLVGLGGDLSVGGPARDEGWPGLVTDERVAAFDADGPAAHSQRILVWGGGVATSGTTVRRWQRGEVTLHHLIDPSTGLPTGEHWRSVTVVAASCVDANIASTGALVHGAGAPDWLERQGLPARLLARDGTVIRIGGWPAEVESAC